MVKLRLKYGLNHRTFDIVWWQRRSTKACRTGERELFVADAQRLATPILDRQAQRCDQIFDIGRTAGPLIRRHDHLDSSNFGERGRFIPRKRLHPGAGTSLALHPTSRTPAKNAHIAPDPFFILIPINAVEPNFLRIELFEPFELLERFLSLDDYLTI
jgi:hypothetical protein